MRKKRCARNKLEPPAGQAAADTVATRLRRIVRRSMVLQTAASALIRHGALSGTLSTPEPPLQSYAAEPGPWIAEGLAVSRQCVREIARSRTAAGARTAVVLMPARFQVDDGDYGRLKEVVAASGGSCAATRRPNGSTGRWPAPLPRVDLLPALAAALPGPDLFFQETVHLTPAGTQSWPRRWNDSSRSITCSRADRADARGMVFNSLHFVWFFVVVYCAVSRAAAPRAELAAARSQLLLLRRLGLALPRAARRLDGRRLHLRARAGGASSARAPPRACSASASAST